MPTENELRALAAKWREQDKRARTMGNTRIYVEDCAKDLDALADRQGSAGAVEDLSAYPKTYEVRYFTSDGKGWIRESDCFAMIAALLADRDAKDAQLAECFRLAGADTDGDDYAPRLAPRAVDAVRQLRADYDEAGDECESLRQRVEAAGGALRVFSAYPLEEFSAESTPDRKLFGANDWSLSVRDVLAARAALADDAEKA